VSGTLLIGLAGWSGSGKTTLLTKLIPLLASRGMRIATLKHAHHAFDVDKPGKDSYEHRKAGAGEVIISSSRRWVQMHELSRAPEPTLAELLRRLSPCDLVLVEGFKRDGHPKLEVFRTEVGKPPLHPEDPRIVAVASDRPFADARVPVVHLDDTARIADVIIQNAGQLNGVLARLESLRNHGSA